MIVLDASRSILVHSEPGRRSGVSAATIPGTKITMQVLTVNPSETAVPGNDLDTETAAYIVSGRAQILSGKDFAESKDVGAGDFYFTPVQLPYVIRNPHDEPVKLVLAYSLDPSITNTPTGSKALNPARGVSVVPTPKDTSTTAQTRGMQRIAAISAETVGAKQIWMCYLSVNPHERGQPHHHGGTHTAAYTISGRARICFGPNFDDFIEPGPGDFAFDPPGLVHLVDHPFDDQPWRGVLARCPQNTVVNFGE
ncbi:hypothetical protein [Methyloferula stellata]|uniref:hypothetical protein n=1 Tax=Methyloferula stellata TaxID=876270 RepID=UPI0006854F4B|nr:hypothetical protein [Methyloferula stellata]